MRRLKPGKLAFIITKTDIKEEVKNSDDAELRRIHSQLHGHKKEEASLKAQMKGAYTLLYRF